MCMENKYNLYEVKADRSAEDRGNSSFQTFFAALVASHNLDFMLFPFTETIIFSIGSHSHRFFPDQLLNLLRALLS